MEKRFSSYTRKELAYKAKANCKEIKKLEAENLQILRASYLLSDKKQQYKEEIVTLGRGKTRRTEKQGRIYWKQTFVDQSTGDKFKIERSRLVRINDEWI